MDCCLRENDEVVAVFPAVLCGLGGWYRDWRSFAGRWCLDSRLRGNDEVGARMTRWGGGRPAGVCHAPPRVPTRDTPTVVLADCGTPVGITAPAGRPTAGDKPQPYIFRCVSSRMAAIRRAVSAKCWTSSGLRGRRRMARSR